MTWSTWKQLVLWTPLRATQLSPVRLTETIFSVGPSAFLVAQPYNSALVEDGNGPYVTILVWAPSLGAVRRALDMEIEVDEGLIEDPPAEMLPAGSDPRYDSILTGATRESPGNVLEHAAYRIAIDGAFVHRSISGGGFHYHFRKPSGAADPPFCISWTGVSSEGAA